MKATIRTILAEYRARLEKIYGPRLVRVVLFGSQARGDAALDSDIDVMIVLAGPLDHWRETDPPCRAHQGGAEVDRGPGAPLRSTPLMPFDVPSREGESGA